MKKKDLSKEEKKRKKAQVKAMTDYLNARDNLHAKGLKKELKILKKDLSKAQLKKLTKYQDKRMKTFNDYSAALGFDFTVKRDGIFILSESIDYAKYTLLKKKRPKAPPSQPWQGDPYTCGPEYFRPTCCNNGYYYGGYDTR